MIFAHVLLLSVQHFLVSYRNTVIYSILIIRCICKFLCLSIDLLMFHCRCKELYNTLHYPHIAGRLRPPWHPCKKVKYSNSFR